MKLVMLRLGAAGHTAVCCLSNAWLATLSAVILQREGLGEGLRGAGNHPAALRAPCGPCGPAHGNEIYSPQCLTSASRVPAPVPAPAASTPSHRSERSTCSIPTAQDPAQACSCTAPANRRRAYHASSSEAQRAAPPVPRCTHCSCLPGPATPKSKPSATAALHAERLI